MRAVFPILILPVFVGCIYYSMAGSIPPHIKSIAIPLAENQTAEFGMSEAVTDNMVNEFTEENILGFILYANHVYPTPFKIKPAGQKSSKSGCALIKTPGF